MEGTNNSDNDDFGFIFLCKNYNCNTLNPDEEFNHKIVDSDDIRHWSFEGIQYW